MLMRQASRSHVEELGEKWNARGTCLAFPFLWLTERTCLNPGRTHDDELLPCYADSSCLRIFAYDISTWDARSLYRCGSAVKSRETAYSCS